MPRFLVIVELKHSALQNGRLTISQFTSGLDFSSLLELDEILITQLFPFSTFPPLKNTTMEKKFLMIFLSEQWKRNNQICSTRFKSY